MIFQMVWVLELAYSGWLFIIFDYGCSLACSFFFFEIGFLFGGGKVSDLGSFTQAQGFPATWFAAKDELT